MLQKPPQHIIDEKDSALLKELLHLVNTEVNQLPTSRLAYMKIKVFLLPAIYMGLFAAILFFASQVWVLYVLYALMGAMVVVIFSNLIHELCHGNIFRTPKHNKLAYHLFDLIGANSYIWKQRHLILHHRYPNIKGWDADLEQKGPVAIFPHQSKKKYQRYQHYYVFMLYPLFFLNWLLVRDLRDFISRGRVIRKAVDINTVEYVKLIFFKLLYFSLVIIIPWMVTEFSFLQVSTGFLILTVTGSILAMVILLTPHINTGNEFPLIDENVIIPMSWLRHQLIATNDISNTNWFTRNIMGNFNYHVAHHLFPRISSVYAPEVTKIVSTFAKNNDLHYRSYPLSVSFKKHYQLLREIATRKDNIE